jgi:hypothetical protein
MSLDKEYILLSTIRSKVDQMSALMDETPLWSADLDTDYGVGDIDACLGLAGLQLARASMLIAARIDEIMTIKQEEWREIGQAEMDAAR